MLRLTSARLALLITAAAGTLALAAVPSGVALARNAHPTTVTRLATSRTPLPTTRSAAPLGPAAAVPAAATAPATATRAIVSGDSTGLASTIGTPSLPQVVREGSTLREVDPANPGTLLPGQYRFAGADAYELTTDWSDNYGCGPDAGAHMDQMMSSLGTGSVMRVWFFESLGTNKYSGTIDWAGMDRAVQTAQAHGIRLIATLGNNEGTCDDGIWHDAAWYAGGYRTKLPGEQLSYAQWVAAVTARYANSPAILAWEPTNEPRPDECTNPSNCWSSLHCPDTVGARNDLRSFFDDIGAEIRSNDPNHLISDGALATPGCGVANAADQEYIDASPGIDLISFHDYTGGAPLPAGSMTQWSQVSASVDKPVFAGENGGLLAAPPPFTGSSCTSTPDRATTYQAKIAGEFAGITNLAGWLFWNDMPTASTPAGQPICEYATWPGESMSTMLAGTQAALSGQALQPVPSLPVSGG